MAVWYLSNSVGVFSKGEYESPSEGTGLMDVLLIQAMGEQLERRPYGGQSSRGAILWKCLHVLFLPYR